MSEVSDLKWFTSGFVPCDLDAMNERTSMLTRIDNKYIVEADDLQSLLPGLMEHYDILQIGDRRGFNYSTRYFDDPEKSAYYEHHQGKRKGFKVRTRRYMEAGLCYVELKMKEKRGTTIKQRIEYNFDGYEALTCEALQFVKNGYQMHYGKTFAYKVQPTLDINYQRLTLVSKDRSERMTIDTDLVFSSPKRELSAKKGVFIVETKSRNGRGHADKCLRALHHYPTKRCSKYCVGMAALSQVVRYNFFLPTMRKLKIRNANIETVSAQRLVA